MNQNKFEDAIANFNKAIELDQNNTFTYSSRGLAKGALIIQGRDFRLHICN